MQFFKCSLVISVLCYATYAFSFTDSECIQQDFQTSIAHKAVPFGWTKKKLEVTKVGCVLTIHEAKYYFIKSKWVIDVCRWPIHIKQGRRSAEVIKRDRNCSETRKTSVFCHNLNVLENVIEESGLIFAEGDREDIKSDHGKMFCSFLLIKSYLGKGSLFTRNVQYGKVLSRDMVQSIPFIEPPVIEESLKDTVSTPVKEK